jgi:hypothetical protein
MGHDLIQPWVAIGIPAETTEAAPHRSGSKVVLLKVLAPKRVAVLWRVDGVSGLRSTRAQMRGAREMVDAKARPAFTALDQLVMKNR